MTTNNILNSRQHILAEEFFKVFTINGEPLNEWMDCKCDITMDDIKNYCGPTPVFLKGWVPSYKTNKDRRTEHIQRVISLINLDVNLWPPIQLDMDWRAYYPIIADGHHRCFAAKYLKIPLIPIEWSGVLDVFRSHFPKSFKLKLFK